VYLRYCAQKASTSGVRSGSLRSNPKKEITTYHRILVGVSILDIMYSFWAALSVLPVPSSSGGVFAHGTVATCSTQAFFVQLTTPIVMYMAALNTYFMLKIRYNVSDAVITRYYEVWFHAIPIVVWLIFGTIGLSLKIFGPVGLPELGCWLGSYPVGCAFTNTCTRGYKFAPYVDWYAWIFSYVWLFLSIIIVFVNTILIYTAIRKQEQRNAKYLGAMLQDQRTSSTTNFMMQSSSIVFKLKDSFKISKKSAEVDTVSHTNEEISESAEEVDTPDGKDDIDMPTVPDNTMLQLRDNDVPGNVVRKTKQSRTAAIQGSLYFFSAFFTAIWIFLTWLGANALVESSVRFFFAFMVNTVTPSQGIFNLFILVRLQYVQLREKNTEWSRWRCIKNCLFSSA
jgi:hypothetical protein